MSDPPSSPFKGLNAFADSELDALLFFGREREREIVVANLIASRLTVLYGPSGVGKSSLLSAAVARSLRELPEEPLVVVFSRWSDDPSGALSEAVAEATGGAVNGSALEALERAQDGRDVYLVLDQTEEYFLYHADDSGPGSFAEVLPGVLAAPLRINVLVSLREDSLAKLDRFTGRIPGLFANTLRLDRLDRQAAMAAIARPIDRYRELTGADVSIEPQLIERVLDEVGAGRIEPALGGLGVVEGGEDRARIEAPYLQLVMQRLWEEERSSDSDTLRLATLERLGGAQHIVKEHLESAMNALSAGQKDVAARLFNHLVTPSGTKIAHEVSDLADFGQVPIGELQPVLSTLSERRILRSLEEGGGVRYEIFHDVLAQPVLAWRANHESERELERQREAADRRHRRLLAIIGIAIVLLAAMVGVTAYALSQRSEAREQAAIAEQNVAEAEKQRGLADENAAEAGMQRRLAERNAANAKQQAALAEENETKAQEQARLAEQNAEEAQAQSERASQSETVANEQAAIAKQNAAEALKQRRTAELERNRARDRARRARASALSARAEALIPAAPVRSVRLALDAARLEPDAQAEETLRRALVASRVRAVLPASAGPLSSASFSPDGDLVVTVASRARLFDARSGKLVRTLPDPTSINGAAFSPDGSAVATAGADASVRVWPVGGGAAQAFEGHAKGVRSARFSRDGRLLVTASQDRTARVWRVASGEQTAVLQLDGPVESAAFSPDARLVATVNTVAGSGRRLARLFDAVSGARLRTFDQIGITTASFSPDGKFVVTTSTDDTTRVWEPGNDLPHAILRQPDGNVVGASFSPDGSRLVTASEGGSAAVWNAETWSRELLLVGPLNPVTSASFSPDGRFVVVSSRDRTAQIFRADTSGSGLRVAVLSGHQDAVVTAAFGPNGRALVTASEDGSARIWDPGTYDILRQVGVQSGAVRRATFSRNGRMAVSASADGSARILLVAANRQLAVLRHEGPVSDAEFSHDGRLVVTASDDQTAKLWRPNGRPLRTLRHHDPVLRATFSPDGRLLATASAREARIWRVDDGRLLQTLRGHADIVLDLAFSPDSRLLASAASTGDRTARIWTIGGRELHVLRHGGPVVRVSFNEGGRLLATASGDETARLWSVGTGRVRHILRGHSRFVRDVEFSRDGTRVVTASDDGDARIWSARTGRSVRTLRGHFGAVRAASFSPDGRWVITAGPRTAGLWSVRTGRFFPPTGLSTDPFLRGHAAGPLTSAVFAPDGRRVLTASADGTVRTYVCAPCGGIAVLIRLAQAHLAALERELTLAERRRYLQG